MHGLVRFIHHDNSGCLLHPDTHAVLQELNAAVEGETPSIITLLGKSGTGKRRLLRYWAGEYRYKERGINTERAPVVYAEVEEIEKSRLGKGVYTTATACVIFSSIMYSLGEIALRLSGSQATLKWYRSERSLYTDQQFLWLFDQVCYETKRLRVPAVIVGNAQRIDVKTIKTFMRFRERLNNQLAVIFSAQLAKDERLDEPMGKLFEQARVDPIDYQQVVELKPLTEEVFYNQIIEEVFADLDADFEDVLESQYEPIAAQFWHVTTGDWKSINSRVRHFNRLLGSRTGQRRMITASIIEQVLGLKLSTITV